jgi:squalene synthase HpnC
LLGPRGVLAQASSENFPVAPRWLGRTAQRRLTDIYGFARLVDDTGDESPGDRLALLDEIEAEVERIYSGTPWHPLMRSLQATVRECDIPPRPLRKLIEANRVDQSVTRYATFDDLLAYCELSANPVGHLVLHAFGQFDDVNAEFSDRICSALQVIEHVQDVAEDARNGRIYMPEADMSACGRTEQDLVSTTASTALRSLLALQTTRSEKMLRSGSPLVGRLSGRAGPAVAGFVGGGLATVRALRRAGHDTLSRDVRASTGAIVREALRAYGRGRR